MMRKKRSLSLMIVQQGLRLAGVTDASCVRSVIRQWRVCVFSSRAARDEQKETNQRNCDPNSHVASLVYWAFSSNKREERHRGWCKYGITSLPLSSATPRIISVELSMKTTHMVFFSPFVLNIRYYSLFSRQLGNKNWHKRTQLCSEQNPCMQMQVPCSVVQLLKLAALP